MTRAELIANFLLSAYRNDPSKTIAFWANKWSMTPDIIASLITGTRKLTKKDRHLYGDLPFSREEYDTAPDTPRRAPKALMPLFKNLTPCPGCSSLLSRSTKENHSCQQGTGSVFGGPIDTRGCGAVRIAQNALEGDPDWPPLFFNGGLPSLGKRR